MNIIISRARAQAIYRREESVLRERSLGFNSRRIIPLLEEELHTINNQIREPPEWWRTNIMLNHPEWNDEETNDYLNNLWDELSTEEQREIISSDMGNNSQGTEIMDESLPLPPRSRIVSESHPEGNDEIGIVGLTCIICMENKSKIFPRCGHVCCCIKCSNKIFLSSKICPVCRELWCGLRILYFP